MGTLRMLLRKTILINTKIKFSLQSECKSHCARNSNFIEELQNNLSLKLKQ